MGQQQSTHQSYNTTSQIDNPTSQIDNLTSHINNPTSHINNPNIHQIDISILDSENLNIKQYLQTEFSQEHQINQLDYHKLQLLLQRLQNEQNKTIEQITLYIENNLYKYNSISQQFQNMKGLIEDSDKINIQNIVQQKLQQTHSKKMELMELKDTFAANKFMLSNLQEMEAIIQKYQMIEKKVKQQKVKINEHWIWQISRQFARNMQQMQKVVTKYQDQQIREMVDQHQFMSKVDSLKSTIIDQIKQSTHSFHNQELVLFSVVNLQAQKEYMMILYEKYLGTIVGQIMNIQSQKIVEQIHQNMNYLDQIINANQYLKQQIDLDGWLCEYLKEKVFSDNHIYFINENYIENYKQCESFFKELSIKRQWGRLQEDVKKYVMSRFNIHIYGNMIKQRLVQSYEDRLERSQAVDSLLESIQETQNTMQNMDDLKPTQYELILKMINRYLTIDQIDFTELKTKIEQIEIEQMFRQIINLTLEQGEKKMIDRILEESKQQMEIVYANLYVRLQYKTTITNPTSNLDKIANPILKLKASQTINQQLIDLLQSFQQALKKDRNETTQQLMERQFQLDVKQIEKLINKQAN